MAVSARTYFAFYPLLVPLIRLYRYIIPIPKSPEPKNPGDEAHLKLVPAESFTQRMTDVLRFLASELPEGIGNYAEFGVYNGTSLIGMYRALSELGLKRPRLLGFDSFRGLPPEVANEDGGVWRPGQFSCPMAITLKNLEENSFPTDRLTLTAGWYKDTLQRSALAQTTGPISVVMIDSDAYSSAKLALAFVEPVLTSVAAIIFDDWKLNNLDLRDMGEYRAFREFLTANPNLRAKLVKGYNRKSKIAFVKRI